MLGAFLFAAALSGLLTALALPSLRRLARGQHIREDVPASHLEKAGTPSMGGIPMLAGIVGAAVVVGVVLETLSARVGLCLGLLVLYSLIGLADDLRKLGDPKSKGILARYRLAAEVVAAAAFVAGLAHLGGDEVPAAAGLGTAGWAAALAGAVGVLTVVGSANAVNLTDGLDGLAAGLTAIAALALTVVTLAQGMGDLALLTAAIGGGAGGFLLLNAKPAKVWMGDVGSLGLGAALAAVAVAARLEFLYAVIGVVFVAEALSVIAQVISFKSTGRRILRMAPLHHHFELAGHSEVRVVVGFWIVGALAAAAGVALFRAVHLGVG